MSTLVADLRETEFRLQWRRIPTGPCWPQVNPVTMENQREVTPDLILGDALRLSDLLLLRSQAEAGPCAKGWVIRATGAFVVGKAELQPALSQRLTLALTNAMPVSSRCDARVPQCHTPVAPWSQAHSRAKIPTVVLSSEAKAVSSIRTSVLAGSVPPRPDLQVVR